MKTQNVRIPKVRKTSNMLVNVFVFQPCRSFAFLSPQLKQGKQVGMFHRFCVIKCNEDKLNIVYIVLKNFTDKNVNEVHPNSDISFLQEP